MVMLHIEDIEVVNVITHLIIVVLAGMEFLLGLAKRVLNSYIKPLTLLINKSFRHGIFPDELNLAKVIPIYKSGSTMI